MPVDVYIGGEEHGNTEHIVMNFEHNYVLGQKHQKSYFKNLFYNFNENMLNVQGKFLKIRYSVHLSLILFVRFCNYLNLNLNIPNQYQIFN